MNYEESMTEFIPIINLDKKYINGKNKNDDKKFYKTYESDSDEIPRAIINLPEIEEIRNINIKNRKKLGIDINNSAMK